MDYRRKKSTVAFINAFILNYDKQIDQMMPTLSPKLDRAQKLAVLEQAKDLIEELIAAENDVENLQKTR